MRRTTRPPYHFSDMVGCALEDAGFYRWYTTNHVMVPKIGGGMEALPHSMGGSSTWVAGWEIFGDPNHNMRSAVSIDHCFSRTQIDTVSPEGYDDIITYVLAKYAVALEAAGLLCEIGRHPKYNHIRLLAIRPVGWKYEDKS